MQGLEQMPRPVALGIEVAGVVRVGRQLMRDAFGHMHPGCLQRGNLRRVVGHQPDRADAQVSDHRRDAPES